MSLFQAPPGTRDILAPESTHLAELVARFARLARLGGYGLLVSPLFEDVGVFRRGVGESSDVVAKEMYELEDKGGRRLALRPEGTAPVVRAFLQHRPPLPFKAWYVTPAFRYERPQAGRYRQHHQIGAEALGTADADLDVEMISLLVAYLAKAGLERTELKVNSMGDGTCRPAYVGALARFLAEHHEALCAAHREGWSKNPMRVLDCKKPECVALREEAPRLSGALCADCEAHFARVLEGLDSLGIAWRRDDFLVRGLDYYTRTTFEVASLALDAAQNAVGGGGRYDGLAELLGGPATPGIGFGSGLDRVLLALGAEAAAEAALAAAEGRAPRALAVGGWKREGVEVFLVDVVGGSAARDLTAILRGAGISADRAFDQRSMKAQLRQADRSGARAAVIVGPDEQAAGEVTLRLLRAADGGGADGAGEPAASVAPRSAGHGERVRTEHLVGRLAELLA